MLVSSRMLLKLGVGAESPLELFVQFLGLTIRTPDEGDDDDGQEGSEGETEDPVWKGLGLKFR